MRTHMKQFTRIAALMLLLFALAFTGPASAYMHGGPKKGMGMGMGMGMENGFGMHRHHRGTCGIWRNPEMVKQIGLSDTQVARIKAADFAHRESQTELGSQIQMRRLEMEKAMAGDERDEEKILGLAKEIGDLKGRHVVQRVQQRLELEKILTAEQRDKLRTLQPPREERRGGKGRHRACARTGWDD